MTRIEAARRRLRIARYAIGVTAAAAFAGFAAVARTSHPATHAATTPATASVQQQEPSDSDSGSFSDGGGSDGYSIGPSGSASPQLQSGAS
jgi:hypothetical protein